MSEEGAPHTSCLTHAETQTLTSESSANTGGIMQLQTCKETEEKRVSTKYAFLSNFHPTVLGCFGSMQSVSEPMLQKLHVSLAGRVGLVIVNSTFFTEES